MVDMDMAWSAPEAPSRRTVLGLAAALALAPGLAEAQTTAGDELVPLWPGRPPGAPSTPIVRKVEERSSDPSHPDRWVTGVDRPALIVRRPARPNGGAVLLVPGGGYGFLAYDNEGTEQATWLNARGITAFILVYRLPGEGWAGRAEVPLQDAQRAMRLIRAGAARFAIDPARVAVLGFSAGGHLAGSLATRHAEPVYAAVDAADRQSARPDLAALVYPVVSLVEPFTHAGSRDNLLGSPSTDAARAQRSVERRIDAATPPMFLVHAMDDGTVPPENSFALASAMHRAARPVELHAFEEGGHGFGARLPKDRPGHVWPELLAAFAARHGVFTAA